MAIKLRGPWRRRLLAVLGKEENVFVHNIEKEVFVVAFECDPEEGALGELGPEWNIALVIQRRRISLLRKKSHIYEKNLST